MWLSPKRRWAPASVRCSSSRQFSARRGEEIDDGEAYARVGDHFFDRYELKVRRVRWRTKWKQDVMLRHGGLCAVPGCTREAVHAHHIVPRDRNGPEVPWNFVAVCWPHHKRGIHANRLTVRGRGGEHLIWRVKAGDVEWVTRGRDDVRRRSA